MLPTSTSERYHHGDLRRALIAAALRAVEREGLAGLTLRSIASDVGVSHAAVYRHFTDKQALVTAVAVEGVGALRDVLGSAVARRADPVEAFQAFCEAYIAFAIEHSAQFRAMCSTDALDGSIVDARDEMMGMFLAGVEACQRAGAFSAGPPEPLAAMAWSFVHGLAVLTIDGALARSQATASTVRATFWSFTKSMRSTSSDGR